MNEAEARKSLLKRLIAERSNLWSESRAMDTAAALLDARDYTGVATILRAHMRSVDRMATDRAQRIEALKDACKHDWQYIGHGHRYDLYECTVCSATRWE